MRNLQFDEVELVW